MRARDRLALAPRRRRARRGCPSGPRALRPLTTGADVPSVDALEREQVLDARGRRLRAALAALCWCVTLRVSWTSSTNGSTPGPVSVWSSPA
jgi:hypothetical protein